MSRFLDGRPRAAERLSRSAGAVGAALGCTMLVVAGCSSSSTSPSTASSRPLSPDVSSFSGVLPSAVASAKASVLESVSAAAASRSAAAASFEASVSAQVSAGRAEAQAVLARTEGPGNALSDVTLTGLPKAQAAGFNAALVTVVNSTRATASYAVKVEFLDENGKVVDTSFLGVKDLAPGANAQPTAFSPIDRDKALLSKVTQAQRY
ncbi:hypothetical protein ACFY2K_43420 [Kitasatospora sp. NPDC001309]|uniref:hypothetical protein n=1 Tax=Kitasatospora sp. NPDC001309 TaxID=3364013 RepID=UPI0036C23FB8